jgi:hydrogenase maturation protease
VHFVFGALFEADGAARMTGADQRVVGGVVVVGLGNAYRRDDGVGAAVAEAVGDLELPNVAALSGIADPMGLLEAWTGAGLAVIIDATIADPSTPGRISRWNLSEMPTPAVGLSSHSVDIGQTHALGNALGLTPGRVVVFTIEAADTGHGIGLSPHVATAVPEVVDMVAAEINRARPATRSQHPVSQ